MQLDRTRIIFLAIIGVTAVVICGALAFNFYSGLTEVPEAAPVAGTDSGAGGASSQGTSSSSSRPQLDSPEPIFGPNFDAEDGLPTYICGADAFGSYFTLQQMQMSGKDIEHGFHLGIVPFFLDDDPAYDVSEEQRTALLNAGQWDCLLTTLDSVALTSPGVITAIVDESAGADQLWARDMETINDLQESTHHLFARQRGRILRLLYALHRPTEPARRRHPDAPGQRRRRRGLLQQRPGGCRLRLGTGHLRCRSKRGRAPAQLQPAAHRHGCHRHLPPIDRQQSGPGAELPRCLVRHVERPGGKF